MRTAHRAPHQIDPYGTAGTSQQEPVVQETPAAGSLHGYRGEDGARLGAGAAPG